MGCVGISDGAAIPRRSVSTMGLAALKITERCAHPFPTCDPAARVTHTPGFAGGGKLAGSDKMGPRAADGAESLWKAIGWPLRATGEARGPAGGQIEGRTGVQVPARWCFETDLSVF